MNPTLLEIIQTHGNGTESTCYCELTSSSVPTGKAELKEGFFFLLVTNGTAQLADEYQTYELQPAHLVTLTPSTKCMIQATSSHFQSMLLYLKPTSLIAYPTDSHYMNNWHTTWDTISYRYSYWKTNKLLTCKKSSLYLHHAEKMQSTITTVF